MDNLKLILGGITIGGVLMWLFGTGLWLLTNTNYPYLRTVGGGVVLGVGVAALICTCIVLDR
jgi:hypothetical protein